jgi:hypothetical protein
MKIYRTEKATRIVRTLESIVNTTDDETLDCVIKVIIDKIEFYDNAFKSWDNPSSIFSEEQINLGRKCCESGLNMADSITNELRIIYFKKKD